MGRSRAGARPAARRGWASARGDQGPTRTRPPDADPIRVDTRVLADYIADSIVRKLDAKGVIDADALIAARVIRRAKDGVRLIGAAGFTSKKVTFKVNYATKGALAAVEAGGGKVDLIPAKEPWKKTPHAG